MYTNIDLYRQIVSIYIYCVNIAPHTDMIQIACNALEMQSLTLLKE